MTAPLAEVYPPYREILAAYNSAANHNDMDAAERLFRDMARAFNAGAEWGHARK